MDLKKTAVVAEKKVLELFGMPYLDHRDRKVIQYVIRSLKGTGAHISEGVAVEANGVITKSLEDFGKVFGDDIASATATKLVTIPFRPMNPIPHTFNTNVQYSYDPDKSEIEENSGFVDHFKTPLQITESDRVAIGHELIHMNKELNLDEYKLLMICSDVIPILYEFIVMGEDKKDILNTRLTLLGANIKEYEMASQHIRTSGKEKDLYRVVQNRSGQYLNSFYYATVLYKMYQNDPRIILEYIRKVVRREMTTLDMLKDLGIYLVDNNELYDEQVQEFRSIIKK